MKKKKFTGISIVFVSCIATFISSCSKQKIVYVDSNRLINETLITKAARDSINRVDSLLKKEKKILEDSISVYMEKMKKEYNQSSQRQMLEMRIEFERRNQNLGKHNNSSAYKITSLERELLQPLLTKMNDLIEAYRKEKGYSFILGTNASGSIAAADKKYDVTDAVVDYFNGKNNGKK